MASPSAAAEAHNKAALILSDCGLVNLAQQLCWRRFDIFHAATPLTAKTAKFALQPIVNLGRLLTRSGHSARDGRGGAGEPEVAAKIAREAVTAADAYIARDVLSHNSCHLSMIEADKHALLEVIESSGLHRGTMPANLLDDLMASVGISEAQLVQLLGQDVRTR